MKPNEIGHFPYRKVPKNSFFSSGYPKFLRIDGISSPTWKSLGEGPTIPIPPEGFSTDNCIYDLQSGNDACYYAANIELFGVQYVWLLGNGWADRGFPFYDDSFDPKEPYKTGNGCYALIKGLARKRFLKKCDDGSMEFINVSTGNTQNDFSLTI